MKHKLLAITLSIAVLSPLALTYSLVILSPFESAIEIESALPRVENYLPFALNVDELVEEEVSTPELPNVVDFDYQ
jgi:hypothetical protein